MALNGIGSTDYTKLSSGKKINSAADDVVIMMIAEGLKAQSNGYDVGASNAATARDMMNVADGGLTSIGDSLQRVRELSLQASNTALYSTSDVQKMQDEIGQLKSSIQDAAKGTSFNTMKLLDKSMADMNLATNPDGSGMSISMINSTLESLGIADYDVTDNFDISAIDKAIQMVSTARSEVGSTTNALESRISYNNIASLNTTASRSRMEDTDMAKEVSEQKKNKLMDDYRMFFQRRQIENGQRMNELF